MKIKTFPWGGEKLDVAYVETIKIKKSVSCDVYKFDNDNSMDLAIISVKSGHKTPLQLVIKGESTIEGFISGEGILTVKSADNSIKKHEFKKRSASEPVEVNIGEQMQWHADGDKDLVFYEICKPPYEDGRYKNL